MSREKGKRSGELPWVGVHVMAEVAFCRRAGVIAHEAGDQDTGVEFDESPQLNYLPSYDMAAMEQLLGKRWDVVLYGGAGAIVLLVGVITVALLFGWLIGLGALIVVSPLWYWWFMELLGTLELVKKRREALDAPPREPDPDMQAMQMINWWSLLNAGYVSIEYEAPFKEGYLKLIGKPWRVLQKGSVKIPVFRKRSEDTKVHRQHLLRVAAYCHLIHACEGADVPYGIILFGNQNDGVAVPANEGNQHKLEIALRKTRATYELIEESFELPPAPEATDVCRRCPFGLPRRYKKRKSETVLRGNELAPFVTEGADGEYYHSTCGDRFRWVPPHEKAHAKQLR